MVNFPELASLMATYGVNKTQLSKIIKKSPAAVTGKMSGKIEWKRPDMVNITVYFKQFDPSVTLDKIFCPDGNNSYQSVF